MPALQRVPRSNPAPSRPTDVAGVVTFLREWGEPDPREHFAVCEDPAHHVDAAATRLMDLYRRTGAAEVFDVLVGVATPFLYQRVRSRVRFLGTGLDPHEVLQDTLVNIYRYPDRFDGSRVGAFRAWSSTIVDNSIRRQLRRARSGPEINLRPAEQLSNEPDVLCHDPVDRLVNGEACDAALAALRVLLCAYLDAFAELSERERFVLEKVEVEGRRYAELGVLLGMRPEALKMVVFRARRRIFERIGVRFAAGARPAAAGVAALSA